MRTNRSAIAFAFGARTGVLTLRMPSLRRTSSKGPLYLLSRSRIKKRTPRSLKSTPRLRACWVTHSPVGFLVQPASQTRRVPAESPEGRHYRCHCSSGGLVVLVDEAAEPVTAVNVKN